MNKNIAIKFLLSDLKNAHMYMLQTMDDVTEEVANFVPPHKANPIAGVYAHLLFSEDSFTQSFLKKTTPLFQTEWKDKTGFSELQSNEWGEKFAQWIKTVRQDVTLSKEYAKAVFKTTETYLETLQDGDLEKEIDMSIFGMGKKTQGEFITGMITGHVWSIMGEISVLKGIQDLKGYPF